MKREIGSSAPTTGGRFAGSGASVQKPSQMVRHLFRNLFNKLGRTIIPVPTEESGVLQFPITVNRDRECATRPTVPVESNVAARLYSDLDWYGGPGRAFTITIHGN